MSIFATMRKTLADGLARIDEIEAQYKALDAARKELEKSPMADASPYWHAEHYLYLIHRTKDGYRPRNYIGKKPEKIKEALASIECFKKHQQTVNDMQELKNRITGAQFLLQQFAMKINGRGG